MSKLEDLMNWENMGLASIIAVCTKFLNFECIKVECVSRHQVESGIWFTVELKDSDNKNYHIVGQTTGIVKERLIKLLDELKLREGFIKPKNLNQD